MHLPGAARLCELTGARYAVLQAPMAGVSTPAMAAGAIAAGCVGGIAAAHLSPAALHHQLASFRVQLMASLRAQLGQATSARVAASALSLALLREAKDLRDVPLAVNLFVPTVPRLPDCWRSASTAVRELRRRIRDAAALADAMAASGNASAQGDIAAAMKVLHQRLLEERAAEAELVLANPSAASKGHVEDALNARLLAQFAREQPPRSGWAHAAGGAAAQSCPEGSQQLTTAAAAAASAAVMKPDEAEAVRPSDGSEDANDACGPLHEFLIAAAADALEREVRTFERQCEVALSHRPRCISFVFGCPDRAVLRECTRCGVTTIVTVTSVEEAHLLMQAGGADVMIAQGIEAGGHRGSFSPPRLDIVEAPPGSAASGGVDASALEAVPLARAISEAMRFRVPVVVAGGMRSARDVRERLARDAGACGGRVVGGIAGIQLGTALLLAHESAAPKPLRDALRRFAHDKTIDDPQATTTAAAAAAAGGPRGTNGANSCSEPSLPQRKEAIVFTRVFSGRWAQGISNNSTRLGAERPFAILPFPAQRAVVQEVRARVATAESEGNDSRAAACPQHCTPLWCGQEPAEALLCGDGRGTAEILGEYASVVEELVDAARPRIAAEGLADIFL